MELYLNNHKGFVDTLIPINDVTCYGIGHLDAKQFPQTEFEIGSAESKRTSPRTTPYHLFKYKH